MTKALEGIRILDFTRAYSGPYCTMLLGDLGAEVIKVERAGSGDDTRTLFRSRTGKADISPISIGARKALPWTSNQNPAGK